MKEHKQKHEQISEIAHTQNPSTFPVANMLLKFHVTVQGPQHSSH